MKETYKMSEEEMITAMIQRFGFEHRLTIEFCERVEQGFGKIFLQSSFDIFYNQPIDK